MAASCYELYVGMELRRECALQGFFLAHFLSLASLIHEKEDKKEYKVISLEILNFLLLIPKILNFALFFKFHHAK